MKLLTSLSLLVAAQQILTPWALLERAEAALRDASATLPAIGASTAFKNGQPNQLSIVAVAEQHAKPLIALADEINHHLLRFPEPWMAPRSQALGYPARPMPTPTAFFSRGKEQGNG